MLDWVAGVAVDCQGKALTGRLGTTHPRPVCYGACSLSPLRAAVRRPAICALAGRLWRRAQQCACTGRSGVCDGRTPGAGGGSRRLVAKWWAVLRASSAPTVQHGAAVESMQGTALPRHNQGRDLSEKVLPRLQHTRSELVPI